LEPGFCARPAQQRPEISASDGGRYFQPGGGAIEVGQRLRGEYVVEVLNRLVRQREAPKYLFADNGAKFTGQLVDLWVYHHGVRIGFSRPGKPTDNALSKC
jgi:putative transposase